MKMIDQTTAGTLLNRYFAGETSLAEETQLRVYFASGEVAPDHRAYAPLFAYWASAQEVTAPDSLTLPAEAGGTVTPLRPRSRLFSLRYLAAAAATVLLLLLANVWCNRQPAAATGPLAGASFPMEAPAAQPVDWSRFAVSADEEGYRALRSALKKASGAVNEIRRVDQAER